jgi:hypothetical protein
MDIDTYFTVMEERFVIAVDEATEVTSREVEERMRRRIPARRRQTRRALEYRRRRLSADRIQTVFRLRFVTRYANGTTTEQVFFDAWDRTRPEIIEHLQSTLETHYDTIA